MPRVGYRLWMGQQVQESHRFAEQLKFQREETLRELEKILKKKATRNATKISCYLEKSPKQS
jgi:hypothetical protein